MKMKIMLTDKETEKLEKAKYRRIILSSDEGYGSTSDEEYGSPNA